MDFVYLIKPVWFGADIVYKVILKDEKLYFCKVGGQFYHISDIDKKYSGSSNEEELIEDSKNSRHLCQDIQYVHIDNKQSWWTGHVMNNGTVTLSFEGKKEKYIIHGYQDAKKVEQFFKQIPGVWVEMRDRFLDSVQKVIFDQEFDQERYSYTKEYKTASIIIKVLNVLTFLSIIGMFFGSEYSTIISVGSLLLPLIYLGVYAYYNKFVGFGGSNVKGHLNIGWSGIPMITLILGTRWINTIYSIKFWIMIVLLTICIVVILLRITKEYKTEKGMWIVIVFSVGVYIYSSVIITNAMFDRSVPTTYFSKIISKSVGNMVKGGVEYNVVVDSWGPISEKKEVAVSKEEYESSHIGDRVAVECRNGFWGIPWYLVIN